MKIVAVTSCITGIAHTYMAAEALEQAAKKAGHEITVETQGSAGSTPMAQATIDQADFVVFACDLEVKNRQRFVGKPFTNVGVSSVLSDAESVLASAVEAASKDALARVEDDEPSLTRKKSESTLAAEKAGKRGFFKKLFG